VGGEFAGAGRRWGSWRCLGVAILVLAADYLTGPRIHFPLLYLLPVASAVWGGDPRTAYALAVAMPAVRLGFGAWGWAEPWYPWEEAANAAVTAIVLATVGRLVLVVATQKRALEREVQTLRGFLPICSFCKKIRDGEGSWQPLERYIGERSEAEFTHGVCPECAREHYGPHLRGPKTPSAGSPRG